MRSVAAGVDWKDLTWRGIVAFVSVAVFIIEIVALLKLDWLVKSGATKWEVVWRIVIILTPFLVGFVFFNLEVEHHRSLWRAELEKRAEASRKWLREMQTRYPPNAEVMSHLIKLGYANVAAYIDELQYKLKETLPK